MTQERQIEILGASCTRWEEEFFKVKAENERLRTALADAAIQIESLSARLDPTARPGHADYINKEDAANWTAVLAGQIRAALASK